MRNYAVPPSFKSCFPGILRLRGADSLDFLNRMSTNDLLTLKQGSSSTTILTTEKGRVIDAVRVLVGDAAVLILTSEGLQERVLRWLERYVIMEDIQFIDETASYVAVNLFGTAVQRAAEELGARSGIPANEQTLFLGNVSGANTILCKDQLWPVDVFTALVPKESKQLIEISKWKDASIPELTYDALDLLMIEQGVPMAGCEMSEEANPLELDLGKFVSFTKGCYIGQEVIARLDSYHKLQKKLTGFWFANAGHMDLAGGVILQGDTEVGKTTRHGYSKRFERNIAMGFLKTGIDEAPLVVVDSRTGLRISAHPTELPFAIV